MKKTLITILCTVLVCSCVMGVTLAFLMDKTETITNTFTVGKVDIDLKETTGSEYKMVPGHTYEKDPTVTVKKNSEACYLFVEVVKSEGFDNYITSNIDTDAGWTLVSGTTNVYYITVASSTADQTFYVLEGDTNYPKGVVTVKSTLTAKDMENLEGDPTMAFTAYAVQQDGLSVGDAWTQAKNAANYSATVNP